MAEGHSMVVEHGETTVNPQNGLAPTVTCAVVTVAAFVSGPGLTTESPMGVRRWIAQEQTVAADNHSKRMVSKTPLVRTAEADALLRDRPEVVRLIEDALSSLGDRIDGQLSATAFAFEDPETGCLSVTVRVASDTVPRRTVRDMIEQFGREWWNDDRSRFRDFLNFAACRS